MKDVLIKGIVMEVAAQLENVNNYASINDQVVYYISGYLASRKKLHCAECRSSLGDLEDLKVSSAADLTRRKSHGKLTYASSNFYRLLSKVEEKVLDFYRKGRIFEANAFHSISEEIVIEKLPVVGCCDDHKVPLMANVIHDYFCFCVLSASLKHEIFKYVMLKRLTVINR